jgi:SAM-dependent methyltransferase
MIGLDPEWEAVGRNESISAGVAGFGNALPFEDETFDFVSANMVVEHLEHPLVDFAEIRRVLRPGGRFVFLTPNANGYLVRLASPIPHAVRELLVKIVEDRDAEDHFPTHYRANTEAEIQEVAEAAGMELTECRHVLSAAEFARFLPLAVIELAWLRFISRPGREDYRPNLVAILTRPES